MARTIEVWTWDYGLRRVQIDGDSRPVANVLQTILEGGLWSEFRKFPVDVIARVMPLLDLRDNERRFLEIWIEEASRRSA